VGSPVGPRGIKIKKAASELLVRSRLPAFRRFSEDLRKTPGRVAIQRPFAEVRQSRCKQSSTGGDHEEGL